MATSYSKICKMTKAKQWDFLQFTNSTTTVIDEILTIECPIYSCAAKPGVKCHSPLAELAQPHKSRRTEMLAARWLGDMATAGAHS